MRRSSEEEARIAVAGFKSISGSHGRLLLAEDRFKPPQHARRRLASEFGKIVDHMHLVVIPKPVRHIRP